MTRHPAGRTCRKMLPVAVLLLPYAVLREVTYRVVRRVRG